MIGTDYEAKMAAAAAELAALEAANPMGDYNEAQARVIETKTALDSRKAELAGRGVSASVRSNAGNLVPNPILAPLVRAHREAMDARSRAEEKVRRAQSLRRLIETGSTHAPFSVSGAANPASRNCTPAEANRSRTRVVAGPDGRPFLECVESDDVARERRRKAAVERERHVRRNKGKNDT